MSSIYSFSRISNSSWFKAAACIAGATYVGDGARLLQFVGTMFGISFLVSNYFQQTQNLRQNLENDVRALEQDLLRAGNDSNKGSFCRRYRTLHALIAQLPSGSFALDAQESFHRIHRALTTSLNEVRRQTEDSFSTSVRELLERSQQNRTEASISSLREGYTNLSQRVDCLQRQGYQTQNSIPQLLEAYRLITSPLPAAPAPLPVRTSQPRTELTAQREVSLSRTRTAQNLPQTPAVVSAAPTRSATAVRSSSSLPLTGNLPQTPAVASAAPTRSARSSSSLPPLPTTYNPATFRINTGALRTVNGTGIPHAVNNNPEQIFINLIRDLKLLQRKSDWRALLASLTSMQRPTDGDIRALLTRLQRDIPDEGIRQLSTRLLQARPRPTDRDLRELLGLFATWRLTVSASDRDLAVDLSFLTAQLCGLLITPDMTRAFARLANTDFSAARLTDLKQELGAITLPKHVTDLIGRLEMSSPPLPAATDDGHTEGAIATGLNPETYPTHVRSIETGRNGYLASQYSITLSNAVRHLANYFQTQRIQIDALTREINLPTTSAAARRQKEEARTLLEERHLREMNEFLRHAFIAHNGHCVNRKSTEYDSLFCRFVGSSQERFENETFPNRMAAALQEFRRNHLEISIARTGSVNTDLHPAARQNYYRRLLSAECALPTETLSSLDTAFESCATTGLEGTVRTNYDNGHTPEALVDYIKGLLEDENRANRYRFFNPQHFDAWLVENFSSTDDALDLNGRWQPAAILAALHKLQFIVPGARTGSTRSAAVSSPPAAPPAAPPATAPAAHYTPFSRLSDRLAQPDLESDIVAGVRLFAAHVASGVLHRSSDPDGALFMPLSSLE